MTYKLLRLYLTKLKTGTGYGCELGRKQLDS